jgi:DNA-binding response OmpR family regulator
MRILVVEDEPVAAAVLAKGLREHAYAVDIAGDGTAALEQPASTITTC